MERASAAIAAAGGPSDAPRIEGPQGREKHAVSTDGGASLSLRGVAVVASGGSSRAVDCRSKGRAELAGCALSSPGGIGLFVGGGATAEVQGGSVADCGRYGVYCGDPGSKATVRTARPRTAEAPALHASPVGGYFHPLAVRFSARSLARRNRRATKANPPKNGGKKHPRRQDLEKKASFRELPLTHRGAGRLRAQLRGVTVERCSQYGIFAGSDGSVELTGCSLRGNKRDYHSKGRQWISPGTITADGRRVG